MSNTKTYEKYIYCLEGNWNKNPRSHQSIKPILDLLRTVSGVKYIYYKCNTQKDFFYRLQQFTKGTYKNYSVLYLAFHGRTNRIEVENQYITLKKIAMALEGKLADKIVHFGSCSTLRTSEKNIQDFITTTNCQFISGYCKDVDFIASTAFELLYFDLLQKYKSVRKIDSEIFSLSPQLADNKLRFSLITYSVGS
ncbi:MAG: hypothetical protein QM653_11865 [Dysgonomonas sp.]|uniref:DUF6642 family protein n=1 Tax=Dysgonomonas sp. TaxID=1891233 RepID=UPI0039E671EF